MHLAPRDLHAMLQRRPLRISQQPHEPREANQFHFMRAQLVDQQLVISFAIQSLRRNNADWNPGLARDFQSRS